MSQEQLTLLVAGIGLAGVIVGGFKGFLSTFLIQKWQQDNELRKERLAVIEMKNYMNIWSYTKIIMFCLVGMILIMLNPFKHLKLETDLGME